MRKILVNPCSGKEKWNLEKFLGGTNDVGREETQSQHIRMHEGHTDHHYHVKPRSSHLVMWINEADCWASEPLFGQVESIVKTDVYLISVQQMGWNTNKVIDSSIFWLLWSIFTQHLLFLEVVRLKSWLVTIRNLLWTLALQDRKSLNWTSLGFSTFVFET